MSTYTWLSVRVLFPLNEEVNQGESTYTILKQVESLDKTLYSKANCTYKTPTLYLCLDTGG